jgi:hypothetical protein
VTFKVRTFRTQDDQETWDFGDGTPLVTVKSDGNANIHDPNGFAVTEHRFTKPGDYIVRVQRANARGFTATAHQWVRVEYNGSQGLRVPRSESPKGTRDRGFSFLFP